METLTLRVVVRPSDVRPRWAAICVDRYMVAEEDSPEAAVNALHAVFRFEVERGRELGFAIHPLEHLPPAPASYHDEFRRASPPPPAYRRSTLQDAEISFHHRLTT